MLDMLFFWSCLETKALDEHSHLEGSLRQNAKLLTNIYLFEQLVRYFGIGDGFDEIQLVKSIWKIYRQNVLPIKEKACEILIEIQTAHL